MLPISQKDTLSEGAYALEDKMHVIYGEQEFEMFINELALQGKHNVYNSMAAALSAKIMNISNPVIRESLTSFKSIPHRMEQVARVKGTLYQRFKSHKCEFCVVCAGQFTDPGNLDRGRSG